jgi:hypothetical protein
MMTDRERLIELIANCDSIDTSIDGDKYSIAFDLNILADHLLANGVRIVVCCDDCVSRESCIFADLFRLVRTEKKFCGFGEERSDPQ